MSCGAGFTRESGETDSEGDDSWARSEESPLECAAIEGDVRSCT